MLGGSTSPTGLGMTANQAMYPPSNLLAHARARTVCFREIPARDAPAAVPQRGQPPHRTRVLLVAYDDGTYGVLVNGRPLPGSPWPEDQLDHCIDAFHSVGRSEAPPGAGPCRPGRTEGPAVHHELGA